MFLVDEEHMLLNILTGSIMTSGSGDTWLTTIDFNGESIMTVQVDYKISTGIGTITIHDTYPGSSREYNPVYF